MALFCAPSINVYSPDPKSVAGVNIKDTSFECIGSSEKDCSLKDPVELPKVPVGVNVPDDTILISLLNEVSLEIAIDEEDLQQVEPELEQVQEQPLVTSVN